jgi:hypothetical protein
MSELSESSKSIDRKKAKRGDAGGVILVDINNALKRVLEVDGGYLNEEREEKRQQRELQARELALKEKQTEIFEKMMSDYQKKMEYYEQKISYLENKLT